VLACDVVGDMAFTAGLEHIPASLDVSGAALSCGPPRFTFRRATAVRETLREADFVLVNCFSPEPGAARAVVPDEEQGGRSATEILLRGGHRRIAFINATTPAPARDGRL
jgi:DNA-binding LacI/PurR family transcriptional regulator